MADPNQQVGRKQRQQFRLTALFTVITVCAFNLLLVRIHPTLFVLLFPPSIFAGCVARIRYSTDRELASTLLLSVGYTTLVGFAFSMATAIAIVFLDNTGTVMLAEWPTVAAVAALGGIGSFIYSTILCCLAFALLDMRPINSTDSLGEKAQRATISRRILTFIVLFPIGVAAMRMLTVPGHNRWVISLSVVLAFLLAIVASFQRNFISAFCVLATGVLFLAMVLVSFTVRIL